jgi:hypothetical protein
MYTNAKTVPVVVKWSPPQFKPLIGDEISRMSRTVYGLCIGVLLLFTGCSALTANSESKKTTLFSGRLIIYAVDNFQARISQTRYVLKLDGSGDRVLLSFAESTDISELRSGMQVEVFGQQQNGYIDVESFHIIAVPSK